MPTCESFFPFHFFTNFLNNASRCLSPRLSGFIFSWNPRTSSHVLQKFRAITIYLINSNDFLDLLSLAMHYCNQAWVDSPNSLLPSSLIFGPTPPCSFHQLNAQIFTIFFDAVDPSFPWLTSWSVPLTCI